MRNVSTGLEGMAFVDQLAHLAFVHARAQPTLHIERPVSRHYSKVQHPEIPNLAVHKSPNPEMQHAEILSPAIPNPYIPNPEMQRAIILRPEIPNPDISTSGMQHA